MALARLVERIERTLYVHYEDSFIYFFEPNFESLPTELIIHLFKYLNPSDRSAAALVCRAWYYAFRYPEFLRTVCLHIHDVEFVDNGHPLKGLLTSFRYYTDVRVTKVVFGSRSEFWSEFGWAIETLTLDNCVVWKHKLISILKYMPRLRSLNIHNCPDLFKSWKLVENITVSWTLVLPALRHLSLARNNRFQEYHFDYLVNMAPNLESLDISECFASIEARQRILMLNHVLEYVRVNRARLRHLFIGGIPVDNLFLRGLADIGGLTLHGLGLMVCEKIPNNELWQCGIIDLLRAQTQLTHLDLSKSLALNDYSLIQISRSIPQLETLILNRCWMVTDYGITAIKSLVRLRHIDLTNCERITDAGLVGGLFTHNRKNVRRLYLGLLTNMSDAALTKVSFEFCNLVVLDLGGCSNSINDLSVQYIFYHMTRLQELNLDCCAKVSDAGITGVDMEEKAFAIWDIELSFSIADLTGLRSLTLAGCYKITDVSFERCFHFRELKELSLARLLQITDRGIEQLVLGCPSLEVVDFSECRTITDRCVEIVTKCEPRLTTLRLQNCPLLTDQAMGCIIENCQVLRTLNIRGCHQISSSAETWVRSAVKTLRHLQGNTREEL
ncbi:F-box/LRR-repeat protein 14-like [Anopheles bellator]|uniref:F-box/LRR-repeat protein 14-like n=1 Tax=Anopheles bellator TaxID=139047 RepID=UPI002648F080|nr:F-box/LRR-repeat protein 14-like [Anopheles bellator]